MQHTKTDRYSRLVEFPFQLYQFNNFAMSAPSPPTLPPKLIPPKSGTPTRSQINTGLQSPQSSPMTHLMSYGDRFAVWRDERLSHLRTWREFFSKDKFALPSDVDTLKVRLKRNLEYYLTNYLIITFVLLAYCM